MYVGNLTFDATEADVRELFSQHGPVNEVALVMDRETQRPRGFGFVTMSSADEGQRAIEALNGKNHDGFPVDIHITDLAAGQAPHAAHHHVHEEIVMVQSGMLDVTIEGKLTRVTPGSVVYVNSNEEHGWKNPGPERAQYFVMAIGREG